MKNGVVRSLGTVLELFVAFFVGYGMLILWGMLVPVGHEKEGSVPVYIRSNGIHSEICVPVETPYIDWAEFIDPAYFRGVDHKKFLSFGWGDKGFYLNTPTWSELKLSTAFTALFVPSESALHIEYIDSPELTENCVQILIDEQSYQHLITYLKGSFNTSNQRVELIEGKGYGPYDNFYEARESYHLFRTCNVWTNRALKSANIRTSLLGALPEAKLRHLR